MIDGGKSFIKDGGNKADSQSENIIESVESSEQQGSSLTDDSDTLLLAIIIGSAVLGCLLMFCGLYYIMKLRKKKLKDV